MINSETIISIFLGIGLAASVGFRVFLPLFVLSLAAYFNILEVNEKWQWLASMPALITLGVAMIFEVFAYYIPLIDNLLDTIAVPLAAIAGTAVMVSTLVDLDPLFTWTLAIIAGGGTAAAISSTTSATRAVSTATTVGMGNPVVSTVETGAAATLSIVSVFIPIIGILLTIFVLFIIIRFYRKIKKG